MGEVYRARDTQLKRDVAIKVLAAALATDADRLARFQREAELLAALNHSHIAHIYGLAEADGVRALAMELVEGDDLSRRIERGAIFCDEALPIARQIVARHRCPQSPRPRPGDRAQIVVQSLKSSERKTLVPAGNDGRYLSTGHLVDALAGVLFAMPFNPRREIEGFLSKLGGVRLR